MNRSSALAVEPTAVLLAHAGSFALGPLRVEPALRRVIHDDGRETILQPRVMQVLVALVRADGAIVSRDDLLAACCRGLTVGEDALNRTIGQLRRLCETLSGGQVRIETVAKVGYRLMRAGRCAAPVPANQGTDIEPVLAVLAFENLSGDPDFLYFSDGISEEILLTVAKTTGLKVLGRASSFQFRGPEKSAGRIAAGLGASHILDGAVRRSGETLRISVQLVDCATQTTLWADRFDRRLADAFALQDEIAAQVAQALKIRFAPSSSTGPIDPEAFDLYLRARTQRPRRYEFDVALLERAVELQPDFGKAWALIAYADAIRFRWTDEAPANIERRRRKVVEAAEHALALDPDATDALLALEMVEPICGAFGKRRAFLDQALARAPNDPLTLVHMAGILDTLGYQRAAFAYVAHAYRLDPNYAAFYYAQLLESVGLVEEARASLRRDIERWPQMDILRATALRFAAEAGDWSWYDQEMAAIPADLRTAPIIVVVILVATRLRNWSPETAQKSLTELRNVVAATGTVFVAGLAMLANGGLRDELYEVLEKASFAHLQTPYGRMLSGDLSLTPLFAPIAAALRRDPRFVDLCVKLGIAEYWAQTDQWPDFAAEVADVYDLKAETLRRLAV